MRDLKDKLEESIQSIGITTELFYQQKIEQGYKQLEYTIAILIDTTNSIFKYKAENHDILIDEKQLVQVLADAMEAMEVKDTVLLSDILQYELIELLDKIHSMLK